MPKYYVASGDLEVVITAKDHLAAAVKALTNFVNSKEEMALGLLFGVSETTFDIEKYDADNDLFIYTPNVVKAAHLESAFPDLEEMETMIRDETEDSDNV